MSTQYGTLSHRKTVQVPMWLIIALIVGAVAIGVGYTVERSQGSGAVATTTTQAVFPAGLETSGVIPTTNGAVVFPGGLETSGVLPTTSHVAPTTADTPWRPIVINGSACHQCR